MLEKVTEGIVPQPYFILMFGTPGVGKSTWASKFEKPLFCDVEDGSDRLDVKRVTGFKDLNDFNTLLTELGGTKHGYKTLVVDGIDSLERNLVWPKVCKDEKISHIEKLGFGKGYLLAAKEWQEIIEKFKSLRKKMNVILIAHSEIKRINDPMLPAPYDKYVIKINKLPAAMFIESVDAVLFATKEVFVQADDDGKKGKAFGDGKSVLYTSSMPGHEGKNRFGLPAMLPLDYDAFIKAATEDDVTKAKVLYKKLKDQIPNIKDAQTRKKASQAIEECKTEFNQLLKIDERVQKVIGVS